MRTTSFGSKSGPRVWVRTLELRLPITAQPRPHQVFHLDLIGREYSHVDVGRVGDLALIFGAGFVRANAAFGSVPRGTLVACATVSDCSTAHDRTGEFAAFWKPSVPMQTEDGWEVDTDDGDSASDSGPEAPNDAAARVRAAAAVTLPPPRDVFPARAPLCCARPLFSCTARPASSGCEPAVAAAPSNALSEPVKCPPGGTTRARPERDRAIPDWRRSRPLLVWAALVDDHVTLARGARPHWRARARHLRAQLRLDKDR